MGKKGHGESKGRIYTFSQGALVIVKSYLLGGPDRAEIWVCDECGSVVHDQRRHLDWHEELKGPQHAADE